MKKVITSSSTSGRYLVQWFRFENGNEDDETEYFSEYCNNRAKAIQMLDDISDDPEYGGIFWAGGLVDDTLTNKTIYEITEGFDVFRDE